MKQLRLDFDAHMGYICVTVFLDIDDGIKSVDELDLYDEIKRALEKDITAAVVDLNNRPDITPDDIKEYEKDYIVIQDGYINAVVDLQNVEIVNS